MRRISVFAALALMIAGCSGSGTTETTEVALAPVTSTSLSETVVVASTTTSSPQTTTTSSSTTTTTEPPPPTTTTTLLDRTIAGERMQEDLGVIVSFGVRESGSSQEADAAQFLRDSLEALGLPVDQRDVPLPTGASSTNLIVTFGSSGPHVLLGAHYDTKPPSPGADDNGSGTVVLLELARRLTEAPPQDMRVTIVFLGAEETLVGYDRSFHHFGSRLLAQQMADDGDLPDLMVSADMIGVGERIIGATYRDLDPAAAELLAQAALELGIDVSVEQRGDISDHEAFAQLGVPSVMFWRPDNPSYHLVADDSVRTEALLDDLAILEGFLSLTGP